MTVETALQQLEAYERIVRGGRRGAAVAATRVAALRRELGAA